MTDDPGPETVECQSCSTKIRKHANICHQCGAENELKPGQNKREEGVLDSLPSIGFRPSSPENVTDQWFYGIIVSLSVWILVYGLAAIDIDGALAGLLVLTAWIGLPVSVYYDVHYVRSKGGWNPKGVFWCLGTAVPLLNIFVGIFYLLRRREHVQPTNPDP